MFKRLLVILAAVFCVAADDPAVKSRIYFGSCIHQDKPAPVWDAIAAAKPDLFIMCGDNIYADTDDMEVMRAKYKKLGEMPGFQAVKKLCPILATWDDHDFGKDDVGADYAKRDESQQIFLDFFGFAKDDPLRKQKGIYQAKIFGPPDQSVQVILLDTRYHRSPMRKKAKTIPGEGPYEATFDKTTTILGEEQWKWLADELKKPAKVRIIVSSIQMISQDHGWEKWANFPHERDRLYKLLQDTRAEGVIFLSGDRHLADLSVADIGVGYPVFDLTSSGLNQGFKKWRFPETNRSRVGGMSHGNNFGGIVIDWEAKEPTIRLLILDEKGNASVEEKFVLDLLKPGIMKSKGSSTPSLAKLDGGAITAEAIKASLDKEVTLETPIVATGANKAGTLVFLNTEKDRNSPTNMTIVLNKKVQEEMRKAGVDNPRTHFAGKTVRVVGPVTLFQDRPQIMVEAASKISVVGE